MNPSPQVRAQGQDEREVAAAENLRFAISDHQEMIRGVDLKAEVLGILPTAVLPAVVRQGDTSTATLGGWLGIAAILAALAACFCVGGVLWPRSDPSRAVPLSGYTPFRVLYPRAKPGPAHSVSGETKRALHTDWTSELTYELWKISRIRAAKQKWFRGAQITSGAAMVTVAVRLLIH